MIFAELRGKLGTDALRAHDRSEDLLTSTVFGLLRYLPLRDGILPILAAAKRICLDGNRVNAVESLDWLNLDSVNEWSCEFWPSFGNYGEPDTVLTLRGSHDKVIHRVLIEVKLWSGKSSWDDQERLEPDDDTGRLESRDQLAKYWNGLNAQFSGKGAATKTIIYLTAHCSPPLVDLRQSMTSCSDMRLAWLSWATVCQVLSRGGQNAPLITRDLVDLLKYKGFRQFDGFSLPALLPDAGDGGFWHSTKPASPAEPALVAVPASRWFASLNSTIAISVPSFWREHGK